MMMLPVICLEKLVACNLILIMNYNFSYQTEHHDAYMYVYMYDT